ncbi:MAG: helix-turn-helix domain-containing protein [Pyrinomonadaceae bacterium]|nr:helix-turn-helix domain-containing protein [Pyrinomonadaceae bacterium]
MSVGQEELITEEDAARYLGVSPERLRELVAQGELHLVPVQGSEGIEVMHLRGEVLRLKEQLGAQEGKTRAEEWPDQISG